MSANAKTANIRSVVASIAVAALLGAGCVNSDETSGKETDQMAEDTKPTKAPAEMTREERIRFRQEMMEKKGLETVSEPDEAAPVAGEVPAELLDRIMADLEGRTGALRAEFSVARAMAVQWNDGSLGCPKPGEMYTQAIVPGYKVVLRHGDTSYDYHASERGYFVLCAGPQLSR